MESLINKLRLRYAECHVTLELRCDGSSYVMLRRAKNRDGVGVVIGANIDKSLTELDDMYQRLIRTGGH